MKVYVLREYYCEDGCEGFEVNGVYSTEAIAEGVRKKRFPKTDYMIDECEIDADVHDKEAEQ